jgi:3-dehydroquinate dehydratase type I
MAVIEKATPMVDLFEVRIDLIGAGWREVAGRLKKPWLACNRRAEQGGAWIHSEPERTEELLSAVGLGADIIDVELATPGLEAVIKKIKGKTQCLLSYHNLIATPSPGALRDIVNGQLAAGADICKVVTTARDIADNIAALQLIREFPGKKIVAFAMGAAGQLSRVLSPLAGGYFTYASVGPGRESAVGQLTVDELRTIYGVLEK